MTIKHYFNPMSRGVTTDWMLKELGVAHETVIIDLSTGEQNSAEFRAINPMGKLPALVDDDTVVTETSAICAYLADKFIDKQLAPAIDSPQRAAYYRYLFVAGNTLEPALALAAAGLTHPNAGSAGWGDKERAVATIESLCPEADWALGASFSTADVIFGGLLDFGMIFGWLEASSKVASYVDRLRSRPAYIESHGAFIDMGFSLSPPAS